MEEIAITSMQKQQRTVVDLIPSVAMGASVSAHFDELKLPCLLSVGLPSFT